MPRAATLTAAKLRAAQAAAIPPPEDVLLTPEQVAAMTNLTIRNLAYLRTAQAARNGTTGPPVFPHSGRKVRYSRNAVLAWMANR